MPSLRKRHRDEQEIQIPAAANSDGNVVGAGVAPSRATASSREPSSPSFRPTAAASSAPPQRRQSEILDAANGSRMAPHTEPASSREPGPIQTIAGPGPAPPPADDVPDDDLRARLARLERAELHERQRQADALAQIRSHMVQRNETAPAEGPQFSERDYAFVQARGMQLEDPRVLRAAQEVQASGAMWPSDSFYRAMEERMPLPQQQHDDDVRLENELPRQREAPMRQPQPAAQRPAKPAPMLASEPRDDEQERPAVSPEAMRRATMYSAPPTREVASSRTGLPSNSRVTLTPTEREIAKSSGLTEIQYAEQKLRLQREKLADPERFR